MIMVYIPKYFHAEYSQGIKIVKIYKRLKQWLLCQNMSNSNQP